MEDAEGEEHHGGEQEHGGEVGEVAVAGVLPLLHRHGCAAGEEGGKHQHEDTSVAVIAEVVTQAEDSGEDVTDFVVAACLITKTERE